MSVFAVLLSPNAQATDEMLALLLLPNCTLALKGVVNPKQVLGVLAEAIMGAGLTVTVNGFEGGEIQPFTSVTVAVYVP